MQRRFFLRQTTTGATAASVAGISSLFANDENREESPTPRIDTHVSIGPWPFAATAFSTPSLLADHLRSHGVIQAWTGSHDALLHHDLDSVNDRLAAISNKHNLFVPFGAVNPAQKNWRKTLNRCIETHRMRGIRLHPAFHGYQFDHPNFSALKEACAKHGLRVQIVADYELPLSDRIVTGHIDFASLMEFESTNIQLLSLSKKTAPPKLLARLADAGFTFETRTGTPEFEFDPKTTVATDQFMFGSNAPLHEMSKSAARLQSTAIASHNAENWMMQV